MRIGTSAKPLSMVGLTALWVLVSASPEAAGQAYVQLNPLLQQFSYYGSNYPSGAGYYGGYGSYSYSPAYSPAPYTQSYFTPSYTMQNQYTPPYSSHFYSNPYYSRSYGCSPRPTSNQPTTTFVPTEITRHPPSMANPWFTSPDYRERHGLSGR